MRSSNIETQKPYDRELVDRNRERIPILESISKEIILLINKKNVSIAESEWILTTAISLTKASNTLVDF